MKEEEEYEFIIDSWTFNYFVPVCSRCCFVYRSIGSIAVAAGTFSFDSFVCLCLGYICQQQGDVLTFEEEN